MRQWNGEHAVICLTHQQFNFLVKCGQTKVETGMNMAHEAHTAIIIALPSRQCGVSSSMRCLVTGFDFYVTIVVQSASSSMKYIHRQPSQRCGCGYLQTFSQHFVSGANRGKVDQKSLLTWNQIQIYLKFICSQLCRMKLYIHFKS